MPGNAGAGRAPPPAVGRGERTGSGGAGRTGVCEGWRGGEKGSAPVSGWTVGAVVWRRRRRGALWAAFGRRAAGCAPLRPRAGGAEARARPRAGGTRRSGVDVRGGGPSGGVPCPSPASPFPGT